MTIPRKVAMVAVGMIVCSTARASEEVLVEVEGFRFKVGSIGTSPNVGGADVDSSLRLEGVGPALRLGVSLGPTRRAELRWSRLSDDYTYATALPNLVLNGAQQVDRTSVDALLWQRLGKTPLHLELGYRYLGLDRFRHDDSNLNSHSAIQSFEFNSQLSGHGVRGAVGFEARLAGPLRVGATIGLSVLRAHETGWLNIPDDGGSIGPQNITLDGPRTRNMLEGSARMLVEARSRLWLAIGYRFEALDGEGGDVSAFDAHGPTLAVGYRFGGHR